MKKETMLLSLFALIIGLLFAGGIFYAYQFISQRPKQIQKNITLNPSPTAVSSNSDELMVEEPADEAVIDSKSVKVSGKTLPNSTVIVTSVNDEQVALPAENGNFSLTTTIGDGVHLIQVVSILPGGEEKKVVRTVTYSTESF
jgi:hypothetical protein